MKIKYLKEKIAELEQELSNLIKEGIFIYNPRINECLYEIEKLEQELKEEEKANGRN